MRGAMIFSDLAFARRSVKPHRRFFRRASRRRESGSHFSGSCSKLVTADLCRQQDCVVFMCDIPGVTAMTTTTNAQGPQGSEVAPLRAKCGWIVALGVIYVIAG